MTGRLDPTDWEAFDALAHQQLDAALAMLKGASDGPVWTPTPDDIKTALRAPLPRTGKTVETVAKQVTDFMPYRVGNTHPRFFGWVHGTGTASSLLAEIVGAAMNANCGGRDHIGPYVEAQVIDWAKEIMGFAPSASGLIVSGTSMATLIAVKSARDKAQKDARKAGISTKFTAYVAQGGHSCIAQAFDILGIGTDALRKVPLDQNQQMDMGILEDLVNQDRAAGLTPLMVVGTAGSVNLGAIDNLDAIADFTAKSNIWFHIDGAFGATAILVDEVKPRLKGLERADSLAFDFHKWMHVNYDAGCVLIKDAHAHKSAFSDRPEYLRSAERGLAAGDFWAVDYGLELSRGFRALKVWAHLAEFGTARIGQSMGENIKQAQYLGQLVDAHPDLTMMCPVMLNIAVFQYGNDDEVNGEIVARLQESGIAVPSTTLVDGRNCIRINITNHRTQMADMDVLVQAVVEAGNAISNS